MSYFKRFFGHLNTILKHKRWVCFYASRLGYTWQGLVHDMSKFSPEEFFESVKYWTGKRSPVLEAKEKVGVSYAWLHHRGRNKHHYEYWVDKLDQGGVPHKIPFKYVIEMVCDWLGACRAYEGSTENIFQKEYDWWTSRAPNVKIHNETKRLITKLLWNLAEHERYRKDEKRALSDVSLTLKFWEEMYNDPTIEWSKEYE